MNTTITARDFYKLVLDATRDSDAEDYQLMHDYALDAIAKLDARNEKRKATPTKASSEAAARKEAVKRELGLTVGLSREDIAEALGITPGQATAALTALVKEGFAVKTSVKVDKSSKMVYTRAE